MAHLHALYCIIFITICKLSLKENKERKKVKSQKERKKK